MGVDVVLLFCGRGCSVVVLQAWLYCCCFVGVAVVLLFCGRGCSVVVLLV